jgi:hypothetical protein
MRWNSIEIPLFFFILFCLFKSVYSEHHYFSYGIKILSIVWFKFEENIFHKQLFPDSNSIESGA